jgi:hypothetical protein
LADESAVIAALEVLPRGLLIAKEHSVLLRLLDARDGIRMGRRWRAILCDGTRDPRSQPESNESFRIHAPQRSKLQAIDEARPRVERPRRLEYEGRHPDMG